MIPSSPIGLRLQQVEANYDYDLECTCKLAQLVLIRAERDVSSSIRLYNESQMPQARPPFFVEMYAKEEGFTSCTEPWL